MTKHDTRAFETFNPPEHDDHLHEIHELHHNHRDQYHQQSKIE